MFKGKKGNAQYASTKGRDADFSRADAQGDSMNSDEVDSSDLAGELKTRATGEGEDSIGNGSSDGENDPSDLAGELVRARAEASENHERYLRALADFDNYKKRAMKERSELIKYQGERVFSDMLEVIDNFERALASREGTPEQFRAGVELIHKMFVDLLAKYEVRSESAVGKDFDPTRHEALGQVEVDDSKPGTIINELRAAYLYKDRLLRPAGVIVATAPNSREVESVGSERGSDEEET